MFKFISALFLISGLLFMLSIIIYNLFVSKSNATMKASHFLASMAIFIGVYVLSGLILSFYKPYVLLFALSPFIIGKIATYDKEKIYSLIQIFCVLISLVLILII